MDVSVVIPTYNRGHVVGEAVASALAQTYEHFEVVVVDDGSTDDTKERFKSIPTARVRYVRQMNAGVSAARNTAVAVATGEIIAFLDSDDLWKPDKLEHEVALFQRHPEVDAVFSDLEKHDGAEFVPSFMRATKVFSRWLPPTPTGTGMVLGRREMFLCLLEEVPILPTAFSIRRRAFEATGRFDEAWPSWEDWEFFLRFARTRRFAYIDRPLAVLRLSPDSLHRVDSLRGRQTMLRLLAREWPLLSHDPEAAAAVRRGMIHLRKQMSWDHADAGRRLSAAKNYVRGFVQLGDPGLLARAAASLMPRSLIAGAKRVLGAGRRVGSDSL